MKSFTYTENFPSDVIYSSSSVSFQKVHLLFVSPFPLPHFSRKHTSALSLLEGPLRKHRFHLLPGARRVRQALALGADAAHTQQRRVRPRHNLFLLTSVATFLRHKPAVIFVVV